MIVSLAIKIGLDVPLPLIDQISDQASISASTFLNWKMVDIYNLRGISFRESLQFQLSLKCFLQINALLGKVWPGEKKNAAEFKYFRALNCYNMGSIYQDLLENAKAAEQYKLALELLSASDDFSDSKIYIACVLNNLSTVY